MLQRSFLLWKQVRTYTRQNQKTHRDRIIGQANADESATDGIKPYETVRRNFSFSVITKKSP